MTRHGHKHQARGHAPQNDDIDNFLDDINSIINGNDGNKQQQTITSVIYVTAKPTFSGPIGGYTTVTDKDDRPKPTLLPPIENTPSTSAKPKPTVTSDQDEPTPTPSTTKRPSSSSSALSSSSRSTHSTSTKGRELTTSTPEPTQTIPTNTNDAAIGSGSASASPSTTAAPGGLSSGAIAGLVIGLIALAAIIGGAIFFFLRKRKRNEELDEIHNEKPFGSAPMAFAPPAASRPSTSTTSPIAPKLDIRPLTQFSPDFGGNQSHGAGQAVGALSTPSSTNGSRNLTAGNGPSGPLPAPRSHNPTNSDPFNDPVNPFENPNSAPSSPPSGREIPGALQVRTPSVGSDIGRPGSLEGTVNTGVVASATALTAITAGVAGAAAVASVATNENPQRPQQSPPPAAPPQMPLANGPPPSPAMSESSASIVSAVPVPVGGPSGGPPGPNNVYRVHLDFNPSMEDELPLQAGQLVRMLHEYDDGWALCVRLDQSQQGVAPRTCLSARPVRPRPRGPPQGPGQRTPTLGPFPPPSGRNSPGPHGSPNTNGPRFNPPMNGRPASPNAGYRPYPPPQNKFNEPLRSLSPGPGAGPRIPQPRSMSPGPYGPGGMEKPVMPAAQRQRSNSASDVASAATALVPSPALAPAPATVSKEPESKPEPTSSPPPTLGPVNRKAMPGQEA